MKKKYREARKSKATARSQREAAKRDKNFAIFAEKQSKIVTDRGENFYKLFMQSSIANAKELI